MPPLAMRQIISLLKKIDDNGHVCNFSEPDRAELFRMGFLYWDQDDQEYMRLNFRAVELLHIADLAEVAR